MLIFCIISTQTIIFEIGLTIADCWPIYSSISLENIFCLVVLLKMHYMATCLFFGELNADFNTQNGYKLCQIKFLECLLYEPVVTVP